MSACVSPRGEYSEHTLGSTGEERFVCQVCGVFDEDAALARIAELEARPTVVVEFDGTLSEGSIAEFMRAWDERRRSGQGA